MSAPAVPDVLVAVVTHDSASLLPEFFAALGPGLSGAGRARVVVADSGSTDSSAALAAELCPDATVLRLDENRGYAAGINAATAAVPEFGALLTLNPDVQLRPRSVGALLGALSRPGVGIAVPRILDERGELDFSVRRFPSLGRAWGEALLGGRRARGYAALSEVDGRAEHYDRPHAIDWATGAVWLVARACHDTAGPWDETFFLYSEEVEFALRAAEAGFTTWFEPEAVAVHRGGESQASPFLRPILVENRARLYARRHGAFGAAAFRAALAVGEGLRALGGSPAHRAAFRRVLRRA